MKKLRRTMLFCPASEPKMFFNTPIYNPDCIIFDLEDAVAYSEKDSARDLLCEAIQSIDYKDIEIFVRVNPLYTEFGEIDVKEVVKAGVRNIRLPMCETPEDVKRLSLLLDEVEKENQIELGSVKIQCAIETPKGVLNALAIATASPRVVAISFGAEDFTRTLGVDRTKTAKELTHARAYIVLAASVANVDAIDTVWADISDIEGFKEETRDAKILGFSGKSCIHPSQVKEVHRIFTPTENEIEKSLRIIQAAKEAEEKGLGVITVDGKMVDKPVIQKAERIIDLAKAARVLK
ncbi:citrate lyase subunit beta/citryl-CoA lyase [Anaerosolibacter carboniphilus]|uniref:Citrate lyase subunit beta/citryl-CoA lyase n=1 Tax=Anaerosolibacter carboniphilus TaxID=1417629 RepID=A0A841KSV7_9FIRM|nr:citrate lyase subunit beta/citryl-CoA lyase [Anaerosolibacter carboniphilus]